MYHPWAPPLNMSGGYLPCSVSTSMIGSDGTSNMAFFRTSFDEAKCAGNDEGTFSRSAEADFEGGPVAWLDEVRACV